MSDYSSIKFRIVDRIAHIELAQPPLNVLTMAAMQEIRQVLDETLNAHGVCAVLLSAVPEARSFSVGIELGECRGATAFQMLNAFHDIFRALDDLGRPVIASVDGAVLGGGCELVAFADLVIATERTTFAQPEIKVGLFPPFASVILPQVIGPKRAAEMIFTGMQINAQTAAAWGLVSRVVATDQLAAKTEEVLQSLRAMSAASLEMARRALHLNAPLDFRAALRGVEKLYLEQLMTLDDAAEGVTALMERRRPVWKDR